MGSNRDYVTVTLTDDALKMARIKPSGSEQKVIGVVKRDLASSSDEELLSAVQSGLVGLEIKKAQAVCVIPSSATTTKNIEIPSVDPSEIKSIIDLQAGRHTPYSREEILIGYINIGVHSHSYTKVLLIIVNRQIIKKQIDALEGCGLRVEKVLFAPETKAKFYSKVMGASESAPVGVIDINKHSTDFTIAHKNTVIACRNIPLGMENILKGEQETKDKLMTELLQSIESYQSEDIEALPSSYVLTGDDAKIKEMRPVLEEKLKAAVKIEPYLEHLAIDQSMKLKIVSEYDDESFLDIVSPLSVQNDLQVDLVPDELKTQRAIEEQGRQVVKAGSFSIILLLLVCGIFFAKIHFKGIYLDKLTKEFERNQLVVTELEQLAANTQIIKDYLSSRMIPLDVIAELYERMPEEVYIKNITLIENGTIHIQGISETRSTAFAFITILENSDLFKSAKMISSNAIKERGKDVSAFEISFKLMNAKEGGEEELEEAEGAEEAPAK